jgi:hypothetical protein
MLSELSTSASRKLLHKCRTYREPLAAAAFACMAKRKNNFVANVLREALPQRPEYDRNQSQCFDALANATIGHELPLNFAPVGWAK